MHILGENTHCQQLCNFSVEDGKDLLLDSGHGACRRVQRCLGLFWMKCSQKAKAIYDRGSLLIISRVDYGEAENLMGRDQLRLDRLREESAGIVGVAQ